MNELFQKREIGSFTWEFTGNLIIDICFLRVNLISSVFDEKITQEQIKFKK